MVIVAIGSALNFMIPLYIQIVQGQSGFETALALIPYQLSILVAAILVVGLYDRFSPRQLARSSFMLVSAALAVCSASNNAQAIAMKRRRMAGVLFAGSWGGRLGKAPDCIRATLARPIFPLLS